ncbi:hypothetical protein Taro_052764 [Colocasia esculenta]|uniref:Uncharacterized protein n=1 Tax=Colocasia esculenta TaxID=4460 RepID=A0A843XKN9_COLES|nr:hypothetical protein [Colocasia esculenta]
MVARLAVDSLAVVFPMWRTLASKSRRSALGSLRHIWVRMTCRRCQLDFLCYSLLGHCRSRCCALGRASGCCVGQLALLSASKFLGCTGGTSCVPVVRMICFIPCARCALTNGGLAHNDLVSERNDLPSHRFAFATIR